jgi:hypothetical protein
VSLFQPNVATDWAGLLEPGARPPARTTGDLSPETIGAYQSYNLSLRPLVTRDLRRIRAGIARVQMFNEHRPLGGRRLLVIDGPSHIGKTTAILSEAAVQTRQRWSCDPGRRPPEIPWIYTEATPEGRGRALTQSLCRFCGIPYGATESASTLIARLAHVGRAIGLAGIIIDDIHFLRAGRAQDTSSLANILKNLITTVPATFVLAGIALESNTMFSRTKSGDAPSDQLANRADWVSLKAWPKSALDGDNPDWITLAASLTSCLAFPRGDSQCKLNHRSVLHYLIDGSSGRPGTAIEWAILAANHAIANNTALNLDALRATRPIFRGPK